MPKISSTKKLAVAVSEYWAMVIKGPDSWAAASRIILSKEDYTDDIPKANLKKFKSNLTALIHKELKENLIQRRTYELKVSTDPGNIFKEAANAAEIYCYYIPREISFIFTENSVWKKNSLTNEYEKFFPPLQKQKTAKTNLSNDQKLCPKLEYKPRI